MSNSLFRAKFILIAIIGALLLVGAGSVVAEPLEKSDVCHYDVEEGVWYLINISGNAMPAHLTNHDDGFPGHPTVITQTELDENCEETALPACGNCLETGHGAGCEVATCESEVCGVDQYCCTTNWDSICVTETAIFCVNVFCLD